MTTVQVGIYIILLCFLVLAISFLMEFYKKTIRRDKANKYEIRVLGLILSILSVQLLLQLNIFHPLLGLIGASKVVDIYFYILIFYVFQYQTDMVIIKAILDSFMGSLLKRAGLSDKQVDDIMTKIQKEKEKA